MGVSRRLRFRCLRDVPDMWVSLFLCRRGECKPEAACLGDIRLVRKDAFAVDA